MVRWLISINLDYVHLDGLNCRINLISPPLPMSFSRIVHSQMQTFEHSSAESLISSRSEGRRTSGSHTSKVMKRTPVPEVFNWLFRHVVLDDAECELNCRPVNQKYFARLKEYAVDGTHCTKVHNPPKNSVGSERSVCVEGKCKVSQANFEIGDFKGPRELVKRFSVFN